jgi:signal peptidase I
MENTLLVGDHVFVDRLSAAPSASWMPLIPYHQVRRGDIIVFYKPGVPDLHLVKRVVGVPGDRLHLRDGVLYVNGTRQNEPYVIHSLGNYDPYRDDFPAAVPGPEDQLTSAWRTGLPQHTQGDDLVVPPNSYFAMGDNRDDSLDSRYWGFVPRENIVGSPLFIYWSFKTPRDEYLKESIPDRIAYAAHVIVHFVDETRWSRMLHRVN